MLTYQVKGSGYMPCLWTLLQWISRNNKDEQDAILEYTYLLNYISQNKNQLMHILGCRELQDIENKIREHISDEQQHSKELTEIYVKLSGIPIADD